MNSPPAITLVTHSPEPAQGLPVTFFAAVTDPAGAEDTLTYTWDFGDDSEPVDGTDLAEIDHVFEDAGSYIVRLTVGDTEDEGDEGDEQFLVQLSDPRFDGTTNLSRAAVAGGSAVGVVENDDLGHRSAVNVIDNGDGAYTVSGFTSFGHGYLNDLHYTDGHASGDTARWTFEDLLPGLYRVSATWTSHASRATDAPYTLSDGVTPRGTIRVNQELAPDDFADAGAARADLGPYVKVTSGGLTVELSDVADQLLDSRKDLR